MVDMVSIAWVCAGGLMEPVWLYFLGKSKNFRIPKYAIPAIFFMLLSPACIAVSMNGLAVGTAYAIWAGIGSVCAVSVGAIVFHDRITKQIIAFIAMIIIGTVGLSLV